MCVSEFPTTGHSFSVKYCPVPCRSDCPVPGRSVCAHATELALSTSATIKCLHCPFICFFHAHKRLSCTAPPQKYPEWRDASGVGTSDLLGCIAVLSIEICLMFNICLSGNKFTMTLQAANTELKSILS